MERCGGGQVCSRQKASTFKKILDMARRGTTKDDEQTKCDFLFQRGRWYETAGVRLEVREWSD